MIKLLKLIFSSKETRSVIIFYLLVFLLTEVLTYGVITGVYWIAAKCFGFTFRWLWTIGFWALANAISLLK